MNFHRSLNIFSILQKVPAATKKIASFKEVSNLSGLSLLTPKYQSVRTLSSITTHEQKRESTSAFSESLKKYGLTWLGIYASLYPFGVGLMYAILANDLIPLAEFGITVEGSVHSVCENIDSVVGENMVTSRFLRGYPLGTFSLPLLLSYH